MSNLWDNANQSNDGPMHSKNGTDHFDENLQPYPIDPEYESDKGYRQIAQKVIEISQIYLYEQSSNKGKIRGQFVKFFTRLLLLQFIALLLMIILNSLEFIPFYISEKMLTIYISSIFVETLGVIGTMIAFAFASKDEKEIVKILNTVITNFQKYKR